MPWRTNTCLSRSRSCDCVELKMIEIRNQAREVLRFSECVTPLYQWQRSFIVASLVLRLPVDYVSSLEVEDLKHVGRVTTCVYKLSRYVGMWVYMRASQMKSEKSKEKWNEVQKKCWKITKLYQTYLQHRSCEKKNCHLTPPRICLFVKYQYS
jgi:hypothetical protein